MNDLAPDRKYTNSAIPIGGVDPHPDKPTGEFLTDVVSNDWVNDEYRLLVVRAAELAEEVDDEDEDQEASMGATHIYFLVTTP